MADQLLVSVIEVTLAASATTIVPHGLKVAGKGVVPTQVIADGPTTIGVLNVNTLGVEFVNLGPTLAIAKFRVEYDHSIHAVNTSTVAWGGWNGTARPIGPAGGDLSGTYPDPTVIGIQGYGITNTMPDNGDALLFNSALNVWEHSPITFSGGPPTGPASRDLGGNYPDPVVVGLRNRPIDTAAPAVGDVYSWDGAKWTPVDINTLILEVTLISGSFSDSTTQNLPVKPATLAVKYNTVEIAGGVTVANNGLGQPTRITVPTDGIYSFDISPQLLNTGGGGSTITFWAAIDGTPVPRSASSLEMGNNNNRTLPFISLDLPMNAGQYLEWFFTATGSNTSLQFFPVDGVIPAIPSVIVNVKRVSALP